MENIDEIRVRPATAADLEAARRLFAEFPYKQVQRVSQRLDAARLTDFYAAGLARGLEAGTPHWVAELGGRVVALAGLSDDPWHASIYGMTMGKLGPWLNAATPAGAARTRVGAALLAELRRHADARFEHLSVRLDGEDFTNLHLFEADGWRLVDISLKFSRPLPLGERRFAPPAGGWRVELATPDDHDWIRRLGSTTHGGTHYLNDPALPREQTEALFAGWLARCCERLAYRIYVLRDGAGQGRGFVTYLRNQGFARAVGRAPLILDFVLLDPAVRGGGVGPWFLEETFAAEAESGFDYCELRTSAHNLAAVSAYEKLGFRCCASDFVLHRRQ